MLRKKKIFLEKNNLFLYDHLNSLCEEIVKKSG